MNYRDYDYYGEPKKSQTEKFTALIVGHKFEVLDVDKVPGDKWGKCDFCGIPFKFYALLKRDDGKKVKIGRTCLERAGLMLRPQDKKKIKELQEKAEEDDILKLLDTL